MNNERVRKIVIAVTALFVVASLLFMFGGNLFKGGGNGIRKTDSTVMPEATDITSEIKADTVVEQDYVNTTNTISKVGVVFSRYIYLEGAHITMELLDGNTVLASRTINVADIQEQHRTFIEPASVLSGMKNKTLTIKIYSTEKEDTGMKLMMARTGNSSFKFGKINVKGTLCFSITE